MTEEIFKKISESTYKVPMNESNIHFKSCSNYNLFYKLKDDLTNAYVSRTLIIEKLPSDFTESQLVDLLRQYGDVKKVVYNQANHSAIVEYWDIRNSEKARNFLNDLQIKGSQIEIRYWENKDEKTKDKNTGTLYVRTFTNDRNSQDSNTLQQYKDLFGNYGEVKKVHTNRKREAEKFIEYYDLRAASSALEALNCSDFNGITLEVQFANKSSKTLDKQCLKEFISYHSNRRQYNHPYNVRNKSWAKGVTHDVLPNPRHQENLDNGVVPIKMQWNGAAGPSVVLSENHIFFK